MASTHTFGSHRLTVDGDWGELVLVGPMVLADSVAIHEALARMLADSGGRGYLLVDITRLDGVGPDVRRQLAAWNVDHRLSAAAVFGGSFAVRTILTLALKAVKFKDRDQLDSLFARDEAEARRWLGEQRGRQ